MTDISPRRAEGLSQLRRLYCPLCFKEQGRQNQPFQEIQVVGGKNLRGQRFKAARRPVDREHGAFIQECIDAHRLILMI